MCKVMRETIVAMSRLASPNHPGLSATPLSLSASGEGKRGQGTLSVQKSEGEADKEKGKLLLYNLFWLFIMFMATGSSFAVQIHPVLKNGRQIQLDGFLLEWKKADASPLGRDSTWLWDVINTREGLTGYFKAEKLACPGPWTFRFLPCRLSTYRVIEINTNAAAPDSFYRVSHAETGPDRDAVCEWIIPWKDICLDSTGAYQIGLFAFNTCKDTLPPLILTGHVFNPKKVSWGGVYGKLLLLGVLLVLLFFLQKSTRGKFRKRKPR
jgi:hypothetical protein